MHRLTKLYNPIAIIKHGICKKQKLLSYYSVKL